MMNWLQRLMYGRYGGDQFSLFLMAIYVVLYLLSSLLRVGWLSWLALVPAAYALFRLISRDIPRRRAENVKFMELAGPTLQWIRLRRTIRRDKDHRYFKCPNCGQQLRVPKGKGKITITCRNCGVSFEEKS